MTFFKNFFYFHIIVFTLFNYFSTSLIIRKILLLLLSILSIQRFKNFQKEIKKVKSYFLIRVTRINGNKNVVVIYAYEAFHFPWLDDGSASRRIGDGADGDSRCAACGTVRLGGRDVLGTRRVSIKWLWPVRYGGFFPYGYMPTTRIPSLSGLLFFLAYLVCRSSNTAQRSTTCCEMEQPPILNIFGDRSAFNDVGCPALVVRAVPSLSN